MAKDEEKVFTVTDRRIQSDANGSKPEAKPPKGTGPKPPAAPEAEKFPAPEMTFASFIISLNTSALIHLGLIPEPFSGKLEPHPGLARQTIDLLGMLEQKTRGNLTPEEQDLFNNILYELRIKYVELGKRTKEEPK